jgi:hypothetical protein
VNDVNHGTYRATGDRIIAFLRDARAQRVPDRDILLAKQIFDEIDIATAQKTVEIRRTTLEIIAQPVIEELISHPEAWSEAINLIAIYLDEDRTLEAKRSGELSDSLRLSTVVLRGFLRGNQADRSVFFQTIDEWNVLHALEPILPEFDLEAKEAVALLTRVDTFTANDMARSTPMAALKQWATAHEATAKHIVEAFLDNENWAKELDLSLVQILIEGAVQEQVSSRDWRDTVIMRLLATNDERRWALAAIIACFAWPKPEPHVEARHEALLKHVERLPHRLVDVGLRALTRDARSYPAASIRTALRLVALDPAETLEFTQRQIRSGYLAEIGWRTLLGAKGEAAAPEGIHDLLPHVLDVPLRAARGEVDRLVAELATFEPECAEAFAAEWLAGHVDELREGLMTLQDALPLLEQRRGSEAMGALLIRCLVDRRPELRLAAAFLVARKRGHVIHDSAFRALSVRQVEALAHELTGIGIPGQIYVPLLLRLAVTRAEVRQMVREILLEEAVEDYPGVCRDLLARWNEANESGDPEMTALRVDLAARIEQRITRYQPQQGIPELWVTSPARSHWLSLQNRIFQETLRQQRNSGQHPFLALAVQVPIARGEGTKISATDEAAVPFTTHSTVMEFPARDSIDRIAPGLSRIRHRQRAAALLEQAEAKP